MRIKATDQQLHEAYCNLKGSKGQQPTANDIAGYLLGTHSITIDPSTVRGRFIAMGQPLGGKNYGKAMPPSPDPTPKPTPKPAPATPVETINIPTPQVPDELKPYIPDAPAGYISRDVDTKLALVLDLQAKGLANKYPIAQGKQGTGKTLSYIQYAHARQLPFFLWSAYEDFNIRKLYGDRTIVNGTVKFQESVFVQAIQNPCVILIDEVNAISEANIKDFNALLQNRQLYIKDADDSKGKLYKLHKECRIGFAQNPKSAKYVGGHIRSSDFLGRCVYLTYPEFNQAQLKKALKSTYHKLDDTMVDNFSAFYMGCVDAINQNNIPVDISIRQLLNIIDLFVHGASLGDAIEIGTLNIMDSISQPNSKQAFMRVSEMVWSQLKGASK